MKSKNFHLFNSFVFFAIGLLVVQQLIVASSTIWITRLIAEIQNGYFSYFFLGLYLTSLLLPYFPGALALVEVAKAKVKSNIHFVNTFASNYQGRIADWTNVSQHTSTSSILSGEAPQTINGYLDYIYHFASCGLNVLFNVIVIALIIEPLLLFSFLIGLILAFVILKIQKSYKRMLALRAQQGRIKWVGMLIKAWDNILLNNSYNFNLWRKKTFQRAKRFQSSTIRLEYLSQGVSIGMAFVLLAPTFALIIYLPSVYKQDLTKLAMMVVALPRLFQVLSYSYEMLFVLADFPMQTSRVKTIIKTLSIPEASSATSNLEARIAWNKINISSVDKLGIPPKQLIEKLPRIGRYTVKGENGTGKSSLLLLLKIMNGEKAFYLPTKHDLIFQLSKGGLSTGQLARKTMNELFDHLEAPIVLLDEWDANLDTANRNHVSNLIDELAQKKCVIEVRHR